MFGMLVTALIVFSLWIYLDIVVDTSGEVTIVFYGRKNRKELIFKI